MNTRIFYQQMRGFVKNNGMSEGISCIGQNQKILVVHFVQSQTSLTTSR